MLRSSLITALRNLFKNKFFSILNILGLALGMIGFITIIQYVTKEFSFDSFYPKNIYRIVTERYVKGDLAYKKALTYPSVGPALKEISPEMVDYARFWKLNGNIVFSANEKNITIRNFLFADPSIIKMLSIKLTHGNGEKALNDPMTVIISQSTAKLFFGESDALNKAITITSGQDKFEAIVTGVFQDLPENTHFDFRLLISFATAQGFLGGEQAVLSNWKLSRFYTYIQLKDNTNPEIISNRLNELVSKNKVAGGNEIEKLSLQPLGEIHLKSNLLEEMRPNGSETKVYFLIVIGIFILFLSYVNYVNMATARAMTRAKEVGIRKVVGASKLQLTMQFLLESLLVNATAICLALTVSVIGYPYYKDLLGIDPIFAHPQFWTSVLFVLIAGALLSGLYPAFVLSSFNPVTILKGKFVQSRTGSVMRKGLVVFQYVISAVLAISTFVVYLQIEFMLNQNLGMNIDKILILKAPSALAEDSTSANKFVYFKDQVSKYPAVQRFTASTEIPGKEIGLLKEGEVRRVGEGVEQANNYYVMGIDSAFFSTFKIKISSGRGFSGDVNFYENIVVNKAAAKLLGFEKPEDAVGNRIECFGVNRIIGVVENFNQQSLRNSYSPIIFYLRNPRMLYSYYALKINTTDLSKTLDATEKTWKEIFPGNPFEYFFLDDFFDRQYKSDKDFRIMFTSFALLAFAIASLGLFGLSSYSVIQQAKEIGIRKVLGAKTGSVFVTLSFGFIRLVLIANVIAIPLAIGTAGWWLSHFAFHISLTWWMYFIPSFFIILLSLIVISYEILKSAMTNPIKVIREA